MRSHSPRHCRRKLKSRRGAVLLDLFLATVMFVGAALAIGELGARSLGLAQLSHLERLATIQAESVLARESQSGQSPLASLQSRKWESDIQGQRFEIEVLWNASESPGLWLLTVQVTAQSSLHPQPTVIYHRLLQQPRGAAND